MSLKLPTEVASTLSLLVFSPAGLVYYSNKNATWKLNKFNETMMFSLNDQAHVFVIIVRDNFVADFKTKKFQSTRKSPQNNWGWFPFYLEVPLLSTDKQNQLYLADLSV